GTTPGGAVTEVFREAEAAEAAEQRFRSELRLNGLAGEWHLLSAGETGALTELAKTVDLTILGQMPRGSRSDGFRPEDIVVASARPVLVIPYAGSFETVGRRALVAWDATREAVRAINDALPLLADAETVTAIFVGGQEAALERQR